MTDLVLREVRVGDHEQIERLKRRYGLPAYTEAEWRHLFEQNPLLRKRRLVWPWGWVLEAPDGSVKGHLGNVPVEYVFRERCIAAAAASDWVVEEEHRGHSLQLVLQFFRQTEAELLLNTTASANYGRAYEALGARQPPLKPYDRNLIWPLDRRRIAQVALPRLRLPSNALTRRLLSAGLFPTVLAAQVMRAAVRAPAHEVRICNAFDDGFDAFWRQLRRREGLVCVRDAEALRWRFGRGVSRGDVWVHTLGDRGSVSGYLIFARDPNAEVKRLRLVDYQDETPSLARTAALMSSVLQRGRNERADLVQAIGLPPEVRRQFVVLGAFPRRMTALNFYFKAKDSDLQTALEAPGGWSPSTYDGDGLCGTPSFFGLTD